MALNINKKLVIKSSKSRLVFGGVEEVIAIIYNSKQQRMSIKKNSYADPNPLIQQDHARMHFASQQRTIQRVHSLRKVEVDKPTFAPDIHEMPFRIYPERMKTEISRQLIVERLIDNRRQKAESLRNEKVRKDEEQYAQNCTFRPEISYQSKRIGTKETKSVKQTHQRLYEQGLSKMKNTIENTYLTNDEDKENCTFQPNVNKDKHSDESTLAPIYQRLETIITQKKEYMRRLQGQKEQMETRAKPVISQISKQIVQNRTDFKKNVLQRLFSFMREKNDRLEKMAEQKQIKIQQQCTFKPEVNYYSQGSAEKNFIVRQEKEAQKTKDKILYLKQISQAPFHPSINKLSSLLIQAERQDETSFDKIERLHNQPVEERRAEYERIEEELYKQCTFQPEINPISKGLQGVPHSHRCACHPKEENYHFYPQINQKSREMAQKMKPKQIGLAIQQARLEQDYKQLKQCTFKPKTMGNKFKLTNQRTSLKNIPGADSYQQRIQKVKDRKKDDQNIKERLFEIQKRYTGNRQTKPQPFHLSQGQNKMGKLREQAQQEFNKMYTFKPQKVQTIR